MTMQDEQAQFVMVCAIIILLSTVQFSFFTDIGTAFGAALGASIINIPISLLIGWFIVWFAGQFILAYRRFRDPQDDRPLIPSRWRRHTVRLIVGYVAWTVLHMVGA